MSAASAVPRPRPEGFALIVVLWFLVLLAAIGTYLLANSRSETALARNVLAAARAEALADSGVAQAVFNLTQPEERQRWRLDGTPYTLALADGTVTIRLRDEAEKINPNLASDRLIAALFVALGVDDGQAARLGAAIADWVEPGDKPRPLGAKKQRYLDAGLNYGPPGAPVDALDDLRLVFGMTPDLFAAARPYLTVNSRTKRPDGKGAADPVRRALAIAAEPAAVAQAATAATLPTASNLFGAPLVTEIEVTARGSDGGVFLRDCVVRIDPANPKGYAVLDWRRGDLAE